MKIYRNIFFAQGEEAEEPLRVLETLGEQAAIEYLSQWDYGEGEERLQPSHGSRDNIHTEEPYILSWNARIGYIGLEKIEERERV